MSERGPSETPLDRILGLSPPAREKLKAHWITSAEQVVAQAATPDGMKRLAAVLEVEPKAAQQLVAEAKALLDPETIRKLEAEHPDDKGMGALPPRD